MGNRVGYLAPMSNWDEFIKVIRSEFPDDRLTYQKAIPTFHPESAQEAASLFKLANKHRQKLFITGFGNNIDPVGEPFADIVTVRTDRLNKFIESSSIDYFVTTGSGYPLREINLRLQKDHLILPHSSLPYIGSVGGALAAGLSSELHGHDFPLKKYFIRAQIVMPSGEIVEPGSSCFKSVSGYDVVKLFSGSWGLLGLIVSATFRIMPDSAAAEFAAMKQGAVDRQLLLAGLKPANEAVDIEYCRKVKAKLDPNNILPIVEP